MRSDKGGFGGELAVFEGIELFMETTRIKWKQIDVLTPPLRLWLGKIIDYRSSSLSIARMQHSKRACGCGILPLAVAGIEKRARAKRTETACTCPKQTLFSPVRVVHRRPSLRPIYRTEIGNISTCLCSGSRNLLTAVCMKCT